MKKTVLTHLGIVVILFALSCIYFMPLLQGKGLPQGDIQKYESMAKAQKDYHQRTGDYSTWCPSMFSGMPGYQITNSPQHSVFHGLRDLLSLRWMGHSDDIGVMFLYLLGFYIALVALGVNSWLALLCAIAFGLGSYNIIIIEAGHITKAWALAMMAPILAGMMLAMRGARRWADERHAAWGDLLWGGILFTLALGTQIAFNHIQITFYTALVGIILGLTYLVYALKERYMRGLWVSVGVLVAGMLIALACNTRHLLVNEEYMHYTMRGGTEITVTPQQLYGPDYPANNNTNGAGLDIHYAFGWSYGIGETYTLLVPGAMGGGSGERVSKESASYKAFHQEQMPLYWGNQPFTSGPVYIGAVILFLFLFGLLTVRGPERWWILLASLLAIVMAWGSNCMGFNRILFEHLPLYNKFRTPSMALVIVNVLAVLMAALGLKQIFQPADPRPSAKRLLRSLYLSAGICLGTILIGLMLHKSFSYSGSADAQMAAQYGSQWPMIQSIFVEDRMALFVHDSWRSLLLILGAAAALWYYLRKSYPDPVSSDKAPAKAPAKAPVQPVVRRGAVLLTAAIVGLLIVIDLQGVDSRYLSEANYVRSPRQLEQHPEQYDLDIDQQAAAFGDQDYRVLNLAVNTFNDSKPSAFHNQVGGYSAAKLRRYQDLIDFYLSGRINMQVLNMLNTRYVVVQGGQVQRNPEALGNCWFVSEARLVENPNEEILALNDFNPATTAIVDRSAFPLEQTAYPGDSADHIELQHPAADLNHLTYHSHAATPRLALFSEVYYAPDWKAYIDGKPAEYLRANYILRAMVVPAGDHTIEFRNEAPMMHRLDRITLIISLVSMLLLAGCVTAYYRRPKQQPRS